MSRNHNTFPQDHSGEYLLLTLKEIKSMVGSTLGLRRPTPKYLRENETLLVRKEMDDCCLEVYTCGFAVYQTAHHYTVMRMEEIGESEYSTVTESRSRGINTENMDWSIGVMLCGEDRIEAEFLDKASDRLISMTQIYPDANGGNIVCHEMELDAGVDIEKEFLEADVIDILLSTLTERQKRIVQMYYFQGITQQEIADVLGIKQPIISKCLKAIDCKAKKVFLMITKERPSRSFGARANSAWTC